MAPTSQWQPTAVTEFKSVTGKWEGALIRDHHFTQNFDRATITIADTGACEYAVVRTKTIAQGGSVSHSVSRVLSENGKLALTDGKLSATGSKGGQMTLQLYVDPGSGERRLKADAKDSEGITYSADLKRTGDAAAAK
jgi:hypothetical protein